jgi:putative flippase GtrA
VSFLRVGLLCTVLYLVGYVVLERRLGPYWANAVSLSASMVITMAADRRCTFGRGDPRSRGPHSMNATTVHIAGLALTTGALWLLETVTVAPGIGAQLVVLGLTSAVATAPRYVLMPAWIFRDHLRTETRS